LESSGAILANIQPTAGRCENCANEKKILGRVVNDPYACCARVAHEFAAA